MMSLQGLSCLLLVVFGCFNIQARSLSPQEEQLFTNQLRDSKEYIDVSDYAIARDVLSRDPTFMLEVLSKMKSGVTRPMENKRGIDFGLGRGFSGSQAAKHFLGMAAASFAGGPGKRKRSEANVFQGY